MLGIINNLEIKPFKRMYAGYKCHFIIPFYKKDSLSMKGPLQACVEYLVTSWFWKVIDWLKVGPSWRKWVTEGCTLYLLLPVTVPLYFLSAISFLP